MLIYDELVLAQLGMLSMHLENYQLSLAIVFPF